MSEMSRAVTGGYGPRYGVFSGFAPEPAPYGRSNSCSHVAPDECPDCNGDRPWKSARIPETTPPCMLPGYFEEAP